MNFLKKNAGKILIFILSLIPIIFWATTYDLQTKFNTISSTFISLTQLSGLVGFVLFAVNIIIGMRSKILEKFFNSIPDIYKLHRFLGISSFVLLSLHPLFIIINYLSFSIKFAVDYIFSFTDLSLSLGKISLIAMFFIILTTIFLKIKYDTWKIIHKILSFSFFIGFFHVLVVNSTVSRNMGLRYYLLFLGTITASLAIYKIIFNINLAKIYKYLVVNIKFINNNSMEIELSPIDKKIYFKPGQFVFIKINQEKLDEEHPFSISSGVNEKNLKITVKNLGDYTLDLRNKLKMNSIVSIDGPYGDFYTDNKKDKIFIAGGIGITPFLSILKAERTKNNITLFFCAKDKSESELINDIKQTQDIHPNLNIIEIYSSIRDRISIKDIKSVPNFENSDIFICASSVMMNDIKNQLINNGFDKKNIYFEDFSFKK